jgi:uncharacterized membrane protein YraQ (UPF0718 family)
MKIDKLLWGSLGVIVFSHAVGLFGRDFLVLSQRQVFVDSITQTMDLIWMSILMGMVMVALLSRVPRAFVMHILGHKAGMQGMMRAALGGVLLDLCNHGILIVGRKLYERGASLGQMMAFLIASPWNSFSLLFILIALLGFGWAMAFTFLSMVIGVTTGLLFDSFVRRGVLPTNPHRTELSEEFNFLTDSKALLSEVY